MWGQESRRGAACRNKHVPVFLSELAISIILHCRIFHCVTASQFHNRLQFYRLRNAQALQLLCEHMFEMIYRGAFCRL